MNSWNNLSYDAVLPIWVLGQRSLNRLSNEIKQEQKRPDCNTIGIKNYLDEVDTVVEEYMQEKMEDEKEISDTSVENIKHFVNLLYNNYITNYYIIPSPMGAICCEWRFEKTSMGVLIQDDNIYFEYLSLKNNVEKDFFQCKITSLTDFLRVFNKVKNKLNAERY